MDEITPEAQRQTLAQQHRRALARSPQRSRRQAARLRMLRLWGGRYAEAPAETPRRRILVIRPDHLGDLLFATPALHLLRASFPEAHIAALVGPWGETVLAGNPDLDEMLICPFPGFTRQPKANPLAPYRLLQAEAQRLARWSFDLALVLRFDHWWGAWLAAAAGIPQRLGYAIDEVQPFLTGAIPYVPGRHEVVQNLALALAAGEGDRLSVNGERLSVIAERFAAGGERRRGDNAGDFDSQWRLRFAVTAEDEDAAAGLLLATDRPVVAIHPGSGAAVKRWRSAAWAGLATRLAVEHNVQVIFTGSAGEAALIDPVLALLAAGPPLPMRHLPGRPDQPGRAGGHLPALRAGGRPRQRAAAPGRGRGRADRASLRPGGPAHLRPLGQPAAPRRGHVGLGLHSLQPAGLARPRAARARLRA
jgi:ADP-heptose:LPS heptosyltransferase